MKNFGHFEPEKKNKQRCVHIVDHIGEQSAKTRYNNDNDNDNVNVNDNDNNNNNNNNNNDNG